jgi:GTP-binding protein
MRLVDTAGLSSTNFDKNPEHLKKVQVATMNHVKFSHVVVYLLDALSAMKQEDFVFVRRVLMEGRAVVLAVNKWEVIKSEYKRKAVKYMEKQI